MSVVADRLVEIQEKDLSLLKNMYTSKDGSRTNIAYVTIDNYMRWIEEDPNESNFINFYCLNGDFSDGTFIVKERNRAYADTLSNSFDNLLRLLKLLDYSLGYIFLSIRSELLPIFKDALKAININIAHEYKNILYHLPKEEARKFDPKRDDIDIRPITELHDFEKINSKWSLRSTYSLAHIQRLAKFNCNFGAFKKGGTLVAWIFRFPDGLLGILQTDENYYGNGYGSLVCQAISREIGEMGHDMYSAVNEANTPSRALFIKLGAKSIDSVYCIATENAWIAGEKYQQMFT